MPIDQIKLSKFLSFVLRHEPDEIGLALNAEGWANIDQLIERANAAGTELAALTCLTSSRPATKKRFSISADGLRPFARRGDIR